MADKKPAENSSSSKNADKTFILPGLGESSMRSFRLRRAIDLIMPPLDPDSMVTYKMADHDLEWLVTDLEGGMRTGCMKANCESQLSRSAVLLHKGKAVGCIYGSKTTPEARPTEESLSQMLLDLQEKDTVISIYDLPEDITVALSALFLGVPVEIDTHMPAKEQFDYIMNWFTRNELSACVVILMPRSKSTCLVFVHRGIFGGAFFVEEQVGTRDPGTIYQIFADEPNCQVEASMLPLEVLSGDVKYGYSLAMAR
jgi:hypothetical protein